MINEGFQNIFSPCCRPWPCTVDAGGRWKERDATGGSNKISQTIQKQAVLSQKWEKNQM